MPPFGAEVVLALSNRSTDREWIFTGTISEDGVVTSALNNHPEGSHSSRITGIRAAGLE